MQTIECDGGVMITGSHNPPEYNGFKVSIGKETIHGEEIQKLKKVIREDVIGKKTDAARKGAVKDAEIITSYINYVSGNIKLPKLNRPLKVVLDSGNGTAGPVAVPLVKRLGCEVVELFSDPDGRFRTTTRTPRCRRI